MGATWGLFRAGFRHQTSYRFALVSGLLTNVFFGLVRTAVFLAVYEDEPTIGLDVEAKATVRDFLAARNRESGTTIFLTPHDTDDIVRLCERLLIIDRGRIISDGPVAALRERFGDRRRLVVDLEDDVDLDVAGAETERAEGRRRWLTFSTHDVPAPEMVARVMAAAAVRDLTVEPPDLEDVIRRNLPGRGRHPTRRDQVMDAL